MRAIHFLVLMLLCAAAHAGELRVGAASVVINPEPGTPMAGYYHLRAAEGVLDDLHAKAIVIEQDGSKAALVVCDLISMPAHIAQAARQIIEKEMGIAAKQVMVSATHSHTGPVLVMRSSRDPSEAGSADLVEKYSAALPGKIAEAVKQANEKLRAAKMSIAIGHEERLSFNRRYFMKDGSVAWNPGKKNPKVDRPAGPIDPEVPVIYVESMAGEPIATHVNFAMHLDTVGGLKVSADYAHPLSEILAKVKGPGMLSMFSIGCAGNINHIDVNWENGQKGPEEARRIGTVLAGEVIKSYARLAPIQSKAPRGMSRVVRVPVPEVTQEQLTKARQVAVKFGKEGPTFIERVEAYKVLDVAARAGKPLEAEVQVIALSDEVALVALPGEIFVELGLAIKKASPFKHTIIVELANGSLGYVPNREAYAQGAYEVVSARCAEGGGEMMVEAAVEILKALAPN